MKNCLALCLISALLMVPSHGAYAALPPLFKTRAVESADITPFTKWTAAQTRYAAELRPWAGCNGTRCAETTWQRALLNLRLRPGSVQSLSDINALFNSIPYVQDINNWGLNDYWSSPLQMLLRNGDCEDYAIAKYFALRSAGWSADQMRIVVLMDRNLNAIHSVLAVSIGGRNYILDNQINQLVTDASIFHYQPIFSINEQRWWRHLPQ
jgi:predicted transglutaminase-like cysteine proteinase